MDLECGEIMMKKNGKDHRLQSINSLKYILVVVVFAVIVLVAAKISYHIATEHIIDISIQNMEELFKHDEKSIRTSLNNKWDLLTGISNQIRQQKCRSQEELLRSLSSSRQLVDCIRLTLVADNGETVNSNMVCVRNDALMDICRRSGDRFIYNQTDMRSQTEGRREALVMGVKISSFSVEKNTYLYLVMMLDIDTLQDELKIDCFDGRGFSSVIDGEGRYIIKKDRNYTSQQIENFYEELEEGVLEESYTTELVKQRLTDRESFRLDFIEPDDVTYVMFFSPMKQTDWYFVMSVPREVFEEQSMALIKMVGLLLIIVFATAIMIAVVLLVIRQRAHATQRRHYEELASALQLAEQANRAKTTFLNNISHDIRTPMNAIIGFVTLASDHLDNRERVKDYLQKISQSASHLLSLINDVLDMSHIESGKMVIEEKPENLADILSGLQNIVLVDVHSKQLEFFVDTVDVLDEDIFCDKLRLNQILLNLLSNAVKYTNPGGTISLKISEIPEEEEGYALYRFQVKDTGIGMEQEFAETIFEPFTRERNTTVSGIEGTGLGMSITKNIVDLMGGDISVKSQVGVGTEFVVTLEFRLQQCPKEVPGDKAEKKYDFVGRRILLVEDNELNREIATEILQENGFIIEAAGNGQEAVEAVCHSEPGYYDLILMDIQMPIMNGYEATEKIRSLENRELASIPIIAMTANAFEEDKEAAFEAGMNAHVGKPIDVSMLLETLDKIMGGESEDQSTVRRV